jgi:tripartite-type tricarboxylate transporter receptor subunit TctC
VRRARGQGSRIPFVPVALLNLRQQAMPDLPALARAGVPEFKADVCFGVVAPAATLGEIIAKLNQELVALMRMPEIEEQPGRFRCSGIP